VNDLGNLTAPFPKEQWSYKKGRGGHNETWVESHWLIDRLNTVVGVGNWDFTIRKVDQEPSKMGSHKATKATAHCTVRVWTNDSFRNYDGIGSITMMGDDAVKGAVSVAMRQCCKYMGIALHLWTHPGVDMSNGSVSSPNPTPNTQKVEHVAQPKVEAPSSRKQIGTILAEFGEALVPDLFTEEDMMLPMGFGKHSAETWHDVFITQQGYLKWLVKSDYEKIGADFINLGANAQKAAWALTFYGKDQS